MKDCDEESSPQGRIQRVGYGVSRYKDRRVKITSEFLF